MNMNANMNVNLIQNNNAKNIANPIIVNNVMRSSQIQLQKPALI